MVPRAFSGWFPWMKKSLSNFLGWPYWSLTVACYGCSSEKPFLTAPIRVNYCDLCAHGASSQLLLQHSSGAALPYNCWDLFRPLDYDLLEDRIIFVFLFLSSSASCGAPDAALGFRKCMLNWINWVYIARSSLPRLALNGVPMKWGSRAHACWFSCFGSCLAAVCVPKRAVREYCATGSSYWIGCLYHF